MTFVWVDLMQTSLPRASDKNKGWQSSPELRKDGWSKREKRRDRRINSRQTGFPASISLRPFIS